MTPKQIIGFATFGSAALLAAAFVSQLFGWAPCEMCLWQRWPHAAGAILGVIAVMLSGLGQRLFAALAGIAVLIGAGIAMYHSGVERKWWDGPSSCTGGGGLGNVSAHALVPGGSDAPPLVLCDTLTPFLFGLTMANWNFLASLGLVVVWVVAFRRACA